MEHAYLTAQNIKQAKRSNQITAFEEKELLKKMDIIIHKNKNTKKLRT